MRFGGAPAAFGALLRLIRAVDICERSALVCLPRVAWARAFVPAAVAALVCAGLLAAAVVVAALVSSDGSTAYDDVGAGLDP